MQRRLDIQTLAMCAAARAAILARVADATERSLVRPATSKPLSPSAQAAARAQAGIARTRADRATRAAATLATLAARAAAHMAPRAPNALANAVQHDQQIVLPDYTHAAASGVATYVPRAVLHPRVAPLAPGSLALASDAMGSDLGKSRNLIVRQARKVMILLGKAIDDCDPSAAGPLGQTLRSLERSDPERVALAAPNTAAAVSAYHAEMHRMPVGMGAARIFDPQLAADQSARLAARRERDARDLARRAMRDGRRVHDASGAAARDTSDAAAIALASGDTSGAARLAQIASGLRGLDNTSKQDHKVIMLVRDTLAMPIGVDRDAAILGILTATAETERPMGMAPCSLQAYLGHWRAIAKVCPQGVAFWGLGDGTWIEGPIVSCAPLPALAHAMPKWRGRGWMDDMADPAHGTRIVRGDWRPIQANTADPTEDPIVQAAQAAAGRLSGRAAARVAKVAAARIAAQALRARRELDDRQAAYDRRG